MINKYNIPIQNSMDGILSNKNFRGSNIIDISDCLNVEKKELKQDELIEEVFDLGKDIEFIEDKYGDPFIPEIVVSQSRMIDNKRKQEQLVKREERKELLTWKYGLFRLFLTIMKKLLISLILLYQKGDNKLRALEWGGINFDRKYSPETIFFLSMSLPESVDGDVNNVLLFYPLISKKLAYRMLKIRREQLKTFNQVFKKK